jgi:hypothetical protein
MEILYGVAGISWADKTPAPKRVKRIIMAFNCMPFILSILGDESRTVKDRIS